jgi:dTDP-4-amino-4,6-dideoxygalactose transaminase
MLLTAPRLTSKTRDSYRDPLPGAHEFTFHSGARRGPLPVTTAVTEQVLTLPLHPYMDDATLERVIAGVRSFFGR